MEAIAPAVIGSALDFRPSLSVKTGSFEVVPMKSGFIQYDNFRTASAGMKGKVEPK